MTTLLEHWIAFKVTFSRKGVSKTTYFPCMPISSSTATAYARAGEMFLQVQKTAARRLAISINGTPPVGPEIHGCEVGYFWHYHAHNRVGAGSGGGYIFYLQ